jgi:FMN phosphatase YigB (HAD superfamily)
LLAEKLLGVIFDLDNTLVSSSLNFEEIRASLGCAKDIDLLDFVDALPTEQQIHANNSLVEFEVSDALNVKNNNIAITMLLTRADHKAKPAPDALLHLAKLWQAPAENLLYVGDYLYDLQAAQNANTMSCLVTHGETPEYANLANIVVNELTELSEVIRQIFIREAAGVSG